MSDTSEATNEDKRYTERIYARCTKSQHHQLNEIRIRMGKENISEVVRLSLSISIRKATRSAAADTLTRP